MLVRGISLRPILVYELKHEHLFITESGAGGDSSNLAKELRRPPFDGCFEFRLTVKRANEFVAILLESKSQIRLPKFDQCLNLRAQLLPMLKPSLIGFALEVDDS